MARALQHAWSGMVERMNDAICTTAPVRHSDAIIDGTRIHWCEMGDPNVEVPLVLLHGMNDSHLTWKTVAPLLAAHHRILMPDFAGFGLSERPDASYQLAWHASVVDAWLAHLGITKADFAGHSFGGGVGLMLLLQCPEKVRRLALVAPGGLGRDVGIVLRVATAFAYAVELFGQPFMALGTRLVLRGATFSREEIAERCAMNAREGSARAFARTVRDVVSWRGQSRLFAERAHEISVLPPIAVYWGDRDTLIPIDHGAAFAQTVKGIVFKRFEGCGHYLHCEQPDAFVEALRSFLVVPRAESVRINLDRSRAPTVRRLLRPAFG